MIGNHLVGLMGNAEIHAIGTKRKRTREVDALD